MYLIDKAKAILLTPKTEWEKIKTENDSHITVLTTYLLWLALIPAVAAFIGYGVIGYRVLGVYVGSIEWGIRQAIMQYITMIGGSYITAGVLTVLAEHFGAKKDFNKAFQLVAYCYTAACVGGIFYIYSPLSLLAGLVSLYSLYLLYIGLGPMTGVPKEKQTTYFVVSLVCMVAVSIVLTLILGAIFGLRAGMYSF